MIGLDDRLVAAELARERRWTLLAIALFVVALGLVLFDCGNVSDAYADHVTPQLALARACAGEASLTVTEDECAAIGAVLARRGAEYSAAFRTCRQSWVCELEKDGRRPPSWPDRWGAWEGPWRPMWGELFAFAGDVVEGEERHRCDVPPDHFGSPEDVRAFLEEHDGWRRIDCGDTENEFLARQRRR